MSLLVATRVALLGGQGNWWLARGTIQAGSVREVVELPAVGLIYAGGAIASGQPWSIVARGNGFVPSATSRYIFDSQTGRVILGMSDASNYGFYGGSWANVSIFPDTSNHVWFLVSTGASIQAYLDGVATGSAQASSVGIQTSGTTRWRRAYDNTSTSDWANAIQRGAVYSTALDATQRAALYASMSS